MQSAVHRSRHLAIFLGLSIYPASFLAPGLRGGSWIRLGDTNADLDLAIFEVVGLKSMKFPWSRNVALGFPSGENFWTVPGHVTQAIQWLMLWLLSRFTQPIQSVTILVLIGFITSGFVTYLISRELGIGRSLAVMSGVAVQALPWMTTKAFHHTSYVYVSVPLLVVYFLIRFANTSRLKHLAICLGYMGLTAFFDPYWFVFSGVIFISGCLCCAQPLFSAVRTARPQTVVTVSLALIGYFSLLALLLNWGLSSINAGTETRPMDVRGVYDSAEIVKWTGVLRDFITFDRFHILQRGTEYNADLSDKIFYSGLSVLLLVVMGLVIKFKFAFRRPVVIIVVVSVLCGVLSTSSLKVGPIDVTSPTIALAQLVPGLRVYARFSPIAQALWVVLAGWSVQTIARNWRHSLRIVWAVICFSVIFLDLGPYSPRPLFRNYATYAPFRLEFDRDRAGGVLIPDGSLLGRELSMETLPGAVNAKLFNTFSSHWKVRLFAHAFTSEELAHYLRASGVTHVIASLSNQIPFISGALQDATRFSTVLNHSDFDATGIEVHEPSGVHLGLYRVRQVVESKYCRDCTLAQWIVDPQPIVDGSFSDEPVVRDTRWITSREFEIRPEPLGGSSLNTIQSFRVRFELRTIEANEDVNVELRIGDNVQTISLDSARSRLVDVTLSTDEIVQVSLTGCNEKSAKSDQSQSGGDPCVGISKFLVTALQE